MGIDGTAAPVIPRTSRERMRLVGIDPGEPTPACGSGPLALRELRGLARLVQAGLLALALPCIAREEAFALQRDAQLGVRLDERAGDPVADGARLAGEPA